MNFGVPKELLEDENSVLHELTKKLSPNEKKLIYETARANKIDPKLKVNNFKYNQEWPIMPSTIGFINKAAVFDDNDDIIVQNF